MSMLSPSLRLPPGRLVAALAAALAAAFSGCSSIERAGPQPKPARAMSFDLDVPRIMRGTVASETVLRGYRPAVVRGYGLVVGLDGTGSGDIPPTLRAHMLAEIARRGFGTEASGFGHISPEALLDSPDTAVVIVEGVIPAGAVGRQLGYRRAVPGTRFDVRVYADYRTSTTSLEGGRLYTAQLRPVMPGELLPPVGSRQASAIADASGTIFVNPFALPGTEDRVALNRTIGRIMNGGEVLRDLQIKLRLANPSHARAEILQQAINTRFPQEPGQSDPTARGESEELIAITVPTSFRDRTDEFVELLRHTTIRQSGAAAVASSIKRAVINDPSYALSASLRWQAIGVRALPTAQTLYDYPEELPRLAAVRAGASLEDPLVTPHLIDMAESASPEVRRQAVGLLGDMPLDARIERELANLLDDEDVDVRLAAYEAQISRVSPFIDRRVVDGKFILDVIDSDRPMIYITQVGKPRVAIFGSDLMIDRPLVVDAWAGRLLLKADADDEQVEVYYRSPDATERVILRTDARLDDFVRFLGHTTTVEQPSLGLGLTYSETVGALYAIHRSKCIKADFRAEQDRVLAAIRRQQEGRTITPRPEFSDPPPDNVTEAGLSLIGLEPPEAPPAKPQ